MAQKKGIIQRLIVGKDKSDGHARASLPSNRWELFWDLLKGRFWKLVILNLLLIVGFVPVILTVLMRNYNVEQVGANFPFSGSYFVGYPQYPDLAKVASAYELLINTQNFIFLVPAMLIAGVVLSGVFQIMRNMAWSEGVFLANDFWKGLKSNIKNFSLTIFLFSVVLLITTTNIGLLDNVLLNDPSGFLAKPFINTVLRWLTYIFAGFCTIATFHALSLAATYDLKFRPLLRNALLLSLGLLAQNIFFLALAGLPFIILLLFPSGMLTGVFLALVLLFGFSLAILAWTIYSQWVYDKFINPRIEGAETNRGIYPKVSKDGKSKKQRNVFANPKKKRAVKPVTDEEITITELPTAFSRADLKRLQEEKEAVRKDSEEWADKHAQSYDDEDYDEDYDGGDDSSFEGYEDAMRLEGYEPGSDEHDGDGGNNSGDGEKNNNDDGEQAKD